MRTPTTKRFGRLRGRGGGRGPDGRGGPSNQPRGGPPTVSATEAARRFAALVDEVRRTGRDVVVTQHGRPVCRLGPAPAPESTVESLIEALVSGPRVDASFLETVESIARTQPRVPRSPWDE